MDQIDDSSNFALLFSLIVVLLKFTFLTPILSNNT